MNIYEREINYYETDKMGVVHHSNYIRFLEEARCYMLKKNEMPFEMLEEKGLTIPVLEVKCKYEHHTTFGDVLLITPYIKEYNGIRMTVGYNVIEKETKKEVILAETKHCFTNKDLKPINLKKVAPEFNEKFEKMNLQYKNSFANN